MKLLSLSMICSRLVNIFPMKSFYPMCALHLSLSSILLFNPYRQTVLKSNNHSLFFFLYKTARPQPITFLSVLPLHSHFSMVQSVNPESLKNFWKSDWKVSRNLQEAEYSLPLKQCPCLANLTFSSWCVSSTYCEWQDEEVRR